jgi:hypothetical protein
VLDFDRGPLRVSRMRLNRPYNQPGQLANSGTESLPAKGPIEMPGWHLEFPLRWPGITFTPPESVRAYSFRQRAAISMKKPALAIPTDSVESRILTIRGQKVILDADLAALYGVTTKRLNEQVKRNAKRFPVDFVFRLTPLEKKEVVANCDHLFELKFSPVLPYAFTENGAVMAANVLNSPEAVRMSVFVVRAFIRMREMLSGSKELAKELQKLESKLTERLDVHETAIVDVLRRIMRLLDPLPSDRLGQTPGW